MTFQGWFLIIAFVAILLALTKPLGKWLYALYAGERTPLHRIFGPIEAGFYRLSGIDPNEEQGWRRYAVHMLIFNVVLLLFTYAVLRLQGVLPLNPLGYDAVGADGAFNTAISFKTHRPNRTGGLIRCTCWPSTWRCWSSPMRCCGCRACCR